MQVADVNRFSDERINIKKNKTVVKSKEQKKKSKDSDTKESADSKDMLSLCYAVLAKLPNGGDTNSTVSEVYQNHCYAIQNNGGRPCPLGPTHHRSNGAYLVPKSDENKVGFEYHCHSPRCEDLTVFLECEELRPFLHGVRCLPPRTLEKYDRLETKIFKDIDSYYYEKMKELGIRNGGLILDKEQLEHCRAIQRAWRHDNHAAINHFIQRCITKETHSAELQWERSPFGFRRRVVSSMSSGDIVKRFSDINITLCNITKAKREQKREQKKGDNESSDTKLPAYVFGYEKVALSQHICGNRKDKMEQSEKICFTGFEFYPALPHEDERTPDQKRGRLNTYGGLDIPPHFAIDWWKNLTPEQREKAEKDLKFLEDDLRYGKAGGDEKTFQFYVKWLASKYRRPWIKEDTNIIVRGEQGNLKSTIVNMLAKIYGVKHGLIVTSIENMNHQFNAELVFALILFGEELQDPNSHKQENFFKAHFDTTTQKRVNQKHEAIYYTDCYYQGYFNTNNEHSQNVGIGERRWFCLYATMNWINKVCEENKCTLFDYTKRLNEIDPRILAYYLAARVDITDFNVKRDRFTNKETATQKVKSLHNKNPHLAFWSKLIENEIHHYLTKDDPAAILLAAAEYKNQLKKDFFSDSQQLRLPQKQAELLKRIDSLVHHLSEAETKPLWKFKVLQADLPALHQYFEDRLTETKREDLNQMCKNLLTFIEEGVKELDEASTEAIRSFLPKDQRPKYMHFVTKTFQKPSFYRKYYLPFQKAHYVHDKSARYDEDQFWKSTKLLTHVKGVNTHLFRRASPQNREYIMPRLSELMSAFAERVVGANTLFEAEGKTTLGKRKRDE